MTKLKRQQTLEPIYRFFLLSALEHQSILSQYCLKQITWGDVIMAFKGKDIKGEVFRVSVAAICVLAVYTTIATFVLSNAA